MPDVQKYRNTMNLGRNDDNKHRWKLGDIVHVAGGYVTANKYNYCGYDEFKIPQGARARIIGIKQTDLNSTRWGNGDVYIDFELVDYTNPDGTPITCGNRHSWTMAEANPDFMLCPDGSSEPGYLRPKGSRKEDGLWVSLQSTRIEDHPEHGYVQFRWRKVVDPTQYGVSS